MFVKVKLCTEPTVTWKTWFGVTRFEGQSAFTLPPCISGVKLSFLQDAGSPMSQTSSSPAPSPPRVCIWFHALKCTIFCANSLSKRHRIGPRVRVRGREHFQDQGLFLGDELVGTGQEPCRFRTTQFDLTRSCLATPRFELVSPAWSQCL